MTLGFLITLLHPTEGRMSGCHGITLPVGTRGVVTTVGETQAVCWEFSYSAWELFCLETSSILHCPGIGVGEGSSGVVLLLLSTTPPQSFLALFLFHFLCFSLLFFLSISLSLPLSSSSPFLFSSHLPHLLLLFYLPLPLPSLLSLL